MRYYAFIHGRPFLDHSNYRRLIKVVKDYYYDQGEVKIYLKEDSNPNLTLKATLTFSTSTVNRLKIQESQEERIPNLKIINALSQARNNDGMINYVLRKEPK